MHTRGAGVWLQHCPLFPHPGTRKNHPLQSRADTTGCKCSWCTALLPAGPCLIDTPVHWPPPTRLHPKTG